MPAVAGVPGLGRESLAPGSYCWTKAVTGAVPFRRASPVERWTKAAGIVMVVPNPDHVNVGGGTSTTGLFPPMPTSASHWLLPGVGTAGHPAAGRLLKMIAAAAPFSCACATL